MTTKKRIIVIGSGFAGMAAAACLAKQDHHVTIVEKNAHVGGRARKFEEDGFVFDMGPSWYWMPDVFERFFGLFGKTPADYYELIRLDPSYRVFFEGDSTALMPANFSDLCDLFETYEVGAGQKLRLFLNEAAYKYEVGINDLVYKPGRSLMEFADWRVISGVFRLQIFQSISKHIRLYFKHPKLIQLLEFPVLFLGATPEKTPALYSLMNYADNVLGTWYPKGGMFKIVDAMAALNKELGVTIKVSEEVTAIESQGRKVTGVRTATGFHEADVVVAAADYHHVEQHLLPHVKPMYSQKYWDKRVMAPSCLIFYLGIDTQIPNLEHHNLFFDTDFGVHAHEIYESPQWPSNPLFYVCCPSKTDPTVAPMGKENLFILIPVASGIEGSDTELVREKYYTMVMERLEKRTGASISKHVIFKKSYAHRDFVSDYHAFRGNAYGLANTLMQTAILKPAMKHKYLDNLYFTGQLTVPGPGVPPSLISGQVVAKEIEKDLIKL